MLEDTPTKDKKVEIPIEDTHTKRVGSSNDCFGQKKYTINSSLSPLLSYQKVKPHIKTREKELQARIDAETPVHK